MKYYAVFYRREKGNFGRHYESYIRTRGELAGQEDFRPSKYTLETAQSLVAYFESKGYEAKIKETKNGTFYEKHIGQTK